MVVTIESKVAINGKFYATGQSQLAPHNDCVHTTLQCANLHTMKETFELEEEECGVE